MSFLSTACMESVKYKLQTHLEHFFTQNCRIISTFKCHFCLRCTTPDAHCYRKFGSQTACRALVKRKNREKKSGLFPQPRLQRCCQTTSIREAVLSVIWGDSSPHCTAPWGLIKSQGNAPPKNPELGDSWTKTQCGVLLQQTTESGQMDAGPPKWLRHRLSLYTTGGKRKEDL